MQNSEEFVKVSHSTERRWKRVLQQERKMRQELQENFEALAKQMHGLENQARRATRKGLEAIAEDQREMEDSHQYSSASLICSESNSPLRLANLDAMATSADSAAFPIPSVNSSASTATIVVTPANSQHKLPGNVQRVALDTAVLGSQSVLSTNSEENLGALDDGEDNEDDDDDKFFDAPEDSLEYFPADVQDSGPATASKKHKRTESSVSVNEAQLAMWAQCDLRPENLPTITTGKKMSVSSQGRGSVCEIEQSQGGNV